ncbi:MAG TPA: hypothetical protein EYP07_10405 [Kiloniellaceae bacterium]|nr:hypothetical protein [Kiloniellaceae bacterium]
MLKKRLTIWAALIGALGLASCGGDPVEQASKDACACLKPLYEKVDAVMGAMKKGDMSALESMRHDMEGNKVCFDKLKAKYPEIDKDKELQQKVSARIEEMCPAPKVLNMGR